MVDVSVISGSPSDAPVVERVCRTLDEQGLSYERQVISAHRQPEQLDAYIRGDPCRVYIAIAGMSAALPGAIASRTARPVIGVPVSASLMGLDALLSIAQMPKGVPVACVGIDAAENAALLAARILQAR
ncbi:MAG: 5-(carboxyamino)imidazole ribonucleotide mutase [Methanomicrobiales archaeon]|nr:5-(carboxyamino)imidazole ribonucleotide mutase [Methanomicrobiales archaeon]MDI6876638.1 5-(carboxyamino)imidazole ribonucleotide mutase [Methanomicrobiales archaeon]